MRKITPYHGIDVHVLHPSEDFHSQPSLPNAVILKLDHNSQIAYYNCDNLDCCDCPFYEYDCEEDIYHLFASTSFTKLLHPRTCKC